MLPRAGAGEFRCFWSSGTGWGTFTREWRAHARSGWITARWPAGRAAFAAAGASATVTVNQKPVEHKLAAGVVTFADRLVLREGDELALEVTA